MAKCDKIIYQFYIDKHEVAAILKKAPAPLVPELFSIL